MPTSGELFVGRSDELALISSCAQMARDGQPGVVWIEGEAGSGKTLLARRALSSLSEDTHVATATAYELAASESLTLLKQIAPMRTPSPFAAGLELLEHLTALAEGEPLAVLVEDLHWADMDSRRALLTLAQRLDEDQLLLLVTSRPDQDNDEWQRFRFVSPRCTSISMNRFSVEETAELAARVGFSLAPRQVSHLHEHTGGHPLYVRTLLAELTPSELGHDAELPVPRSLASTTTAALARLPQPARSLACALAVLNSAVPLAVAGDVAGLEDPSLALEQLLTSGLAVWHPREPQTPVELAHPLFRIAIYDDLPPTTRRRLHIAAAKVTDDATALVHRVHAADSSDDELADELASSATSDGSGIPVTTKAQYLLWSSAVTSDRSRREARFLQAMQTLLADRQVSRALAHRSDVERCAPSAERSLVLGMMDWIRGEPISAEAHFEAASTPEAAHDSPAIATHALARLATISVTRLEAAQAIAAAERGLRLAAEDEGLIRLVIPPLAAATGIAEGPEAGLALMARYFTAPPDRAGYLDADTLVTRGLIAYYGGHLAGPVEDLRRAVALGRQGAPIAQLPRAHVHLCQLLFKSGEWDDAQVQARLALSLIADDPHVWEEAQVLAAASLVPAARGQFDTATARLEEARRVALTPESDMACRWADANLARAQGAWTDVASALSPLIEVVGLRRVVGPLRCWTLYIEALAASGELSAARRQLDDLETAASDGLTARSMDYFSAVAALAVGEGRPQDATLAFDRAFESRNDNDPVLDRALLFHALGRHLHAIGDRAGSLRSLRSALELLEPLGAAPYLSRLEADLATWGVKVEEGRSRATTLELSEREQSVAALVGRGLTNRQVAEELYVSKKAVEYHLSNIYGKLGITSRQELRNHPALARAAIGA